MASTSKLEDSSDLSDDSDDDADDDDGHHVNRKGSKYVSRSTNHDRHGYNEDESDSDDGYEAVDDITDGDEEDQNVEEAEELMIMESEKAGVPGNAFDSTLFAEDGMFLPSENILDDEQLYAAMETFGESEDGASDAAEETPVPRHVHFQESDSSTSDSDPPTEDELPGDFLQQDSLDPQLQQMIENDNDNRANHLAPSDDVFGDSDYGNANIYHLESDAESSGSSGYESMRKPSFNYLYKITANPIP